MSSRITRSAARSAAQLAATQASERDDNEAEPAPLPPTVNKRKTRLSDTGSTNTPSRSSPTGRQSKRQRLEESGIEIEGQASVTPKSASSRGKQRVMSTSGYGNDSD